MLPLAAATIAAFFGGTGPAALVAIGSEPYLQYYVVPPTHSFALTWPKGYVGMLFYLGLFAIVVALTRAMFASQGSLRRVNERLEEMVTAGTAGLPELQVTNQNLEALVEARAGELRLANEEVQRFAYIVSHDSRAPLVNVLGFTSELDASRGQPCGFLDNARAATPLLVTDDFCEAVEADMPEALGFIRSSTQKMDRLIGMILKLPREGKRRLTPEPIDLGDLVAMQRSSPAQKLFARDATLLVRDALSSPRQRQARGRADIWQPHRESVQEPVTGPPWKNRAA